MSFYLFALLAPFPIVLFVLGIMWDHRISQGNWYANELYMAEVSKRTKRIREFMNESL